MSGEYLPVLQVVFGTAVSFYDNKQHSKQNSDISPCISLSRLPPPFSIFYLNKIKIGTDGQYTRAIDRMQIMFYNLIKYYIHIQNLVVIHYS